MSVDIIPKNNQKQKYVDNIPQNDQEQEHQRKKTVKEMLEGHRIYCYPAKGNIRASCYLSVYEKERL